MVSKCKQGCKEKEGWKFKSKVTNLKGGGRIRGGGAAKPEPWSFCCLFLESCGRSIGAMFVNFFVVIFDKLRL